MTAPLGLLRFDYVRPLTDAEITAWVEEALRRAFRASLIGEQDADAERVIRLVGQLVRERAARKDGGPL